MGEKKKTSAVWNGACGESAGHKCTLTTASDPCLRLSDMETLRCRRATPAWQRLAVVRFNFCGDGQQIVEASEWTSRVTGRKTNTAALSLIIKSVCKKFPGINFWPLQWTEESMAYNEFTSQQLRHSPQSFCILYACILRTMTQFSFSTQLFHSSVIWEKLTALMDTIVTDRFASMISNVKTNPVDFTIIVVKKIHFI